MEKPYKFQLHRPDINWVYIFGTFVVLLMFSRNRRGPECSYFERSFFIQATGLKIHRNTSQSVNELVLKLDHGTIMAPSRHHYGTIMAPIMAPSWHHHGTDHGTIMAQSRHHHGTIMAQIMAQSWHHHGTIMAPIL